MERIPTSLVGLWETSFRASVMKLDDYKVVLYRNQPDGWVAEVHRFPVVTR